MTALTLPVHIFVSIFKTLISMEQKLTYVSPQSEEFKLQLEGVIAASTGPQFIDPFSGNQDNNF